MRSLKLFFVAICFFISISFFAQSNATSKNSATVTETSAVSTNPDFKIRYYYYPNLEAYFDVKKNVFYFLQSGNWTVAEDIPRGYHGYGMFNRCKVGITDYDGEDPTQFLKIHKKQYPYAPNGKIKNMMAANE